MYFNNSAGSAGNSYQAQGVPAPAIIPSEFRVPCPGTNWPRWPPPCFPGTAPPFHNNNFSSTGASGNRGFFPNPPPTQNSHHWKASPAGGTPDQNKGTLSEWSAIVQNAACNKTAGESSSYNMDHSFHMESYKGQHFNHDNKSKNPNSKLQGRTNAPFFNNSNPHNVDPGGTYSFPYSFPPPLPLQPPLPPPQIIFRPPEPPEPPPEPQPVPPGTEEFDTNIERKSSSSAKSSSCIQSSSKIANDSSESPIKENLTDSVKSPALEKRVNSEASLVEVASNEQLSHFQKPSNSCDDVDPIPESTLGISKCSAKVSPDSNAELGNKRGELDKGRSTSYQCPFVNGSRAEIDNSQFRQNYALSGDEGRKKAGSFDMSKKDMNDGRFLSHQKTNKKVNAERFGEIPYGLHLPNDDLRSFRHGRVQSVKLLSEDTSASAGGSISGGNGGVRSGKSATVAFIDIRSAAKAFRAVHSMAGQPLDINYHEPGSAPPRCHPPMDSHPSTEAPSDIPVVIGQGSTNNNNNVGPNQNPGMHNNSIPGPSMYRQQRFPLQHGQSEDSSSHFYDQPKGFSRGRGDGHGYRGRRENRHNNYNRHSFHNNVDRSYRMSWGYSNESSRVAPPAHSQADERTTGPSPTTHPPVTSEVTKPPRRPDSPASTVSSRHVPSKRHKSRSVSESGSSDRGSTAGSRSRSGSRSSVSTSVSSGRSRSPPHHSSSNHFSRGGSGAVRFHQNNSYSRQRYRRSRVTNRPTDSRARHSSRSPVAASPSSSTSSSPSPHRKAATLPPHSPSHSPSSSKSYSPSRGASTTSHHHHPHHRRPPSTAELHAAIKIRNLPIRSSDTSLKDGLFHLFKRNGKVAYVRVIGESEKRYAIVCFKSQEYAAKAVESSQDKQFFGNKIQVTLYYTGKSEESVGGTDEESRGPGEEESSSFPTRTVLVTCLDSSVTVSELKSVFDQYGDIVNIDIRKQGSSTHAVCEFLDIASSIRAKWGRHVFKSREARISFFRNPPTNALLLDGTAGVTEKQVTSHCCQYGAIRRVDMDPERFLALVQYEEISSAETAIRELGNWAIKGKKLDIDFASQEVIRRFQERLEAGLGNSSLSICGSSSPCSNPMAPLGVGPFKEGSVRKARSRLGEYLGDDDSLKSGFHAYRNEMDGDSKPMTTLKSIDESSPPSNLNAGRILNASRESHESLNSTLEIHGYRRLEPTIDSQRSTMACTKSNGKERTDKFSNSGSVKIDLNCHETDSAIVTSSSSDIVTSSSDICNNFNEGHNNVQVGNKIVLASSSSSDIIAVENSDTDVHSNFTGSSTSGDEKVGSFEPAIKHRKSSSENVSSVLTTTTVDGVSSTSPEPKSEIVGTSADPGVGIGTDSVARYLNDAVATDSQKRLVDSKIRRTSADSGNHLNSSPECHPLHSNQETEKVPSSQLGRRSEGGNPRPATLSNSQGTDDADDRPGTPLCDENPEGFDAAAPSQKSTTTSASAPPSNKSSNKSEPASLQETSKHKTVKSQSAVSVKDTKSNDGSGSGVSPSVKKLVMSPTISPSSGASSSVMLSSTNDTSIFSPNTESSETQAYSKSSTNSFENLNTTSNFCVVGEVAVKRESSDDVSNGAVLSDTNNVEQRVSSEQVKCEVVEKDEFASGAGFSSDSEGGLSPRHSPTADSLEQRVKNLCERYDTWDGNRKILKHTPPVSHSPHHASTNQDTNSGSGNSSDSLIDKIKETIPNFSGTSDIVRTVLARKSIFDEDCERLVNFNEKYETKPSTLITTSTNWKLPTLSRTTSCSSNSSAPYLGQTSPLAVNSNCVPPLSSPISSISPITSSGSVNFNSTALSSASTKPTIIPLCATSPSYSSPSLSIAIVGKSISEKVKDLNANVAPQLNRSLSLSSTSTSSLSSLSAGQLATKSFGSASGPTKPVGFSAAGAPTPPAIPSASTKSFSSFQSTPSSPFPTAKPSNDLTLTSSIGPLIPKMEVATPISIKKVPPVHPLIIPNTLNALTSSVSHALTTGHSSASSPIPVQSGNFIRSVDRSLSVESKKSSPGISTPGFQGGFPGSSYSSESFGSADTVRPLTPRRISVDTGSSSTSSSVSTDSSGSSKQSLQLPATSGDKPAEVSDKSEVTRTEKYGSVCGPSDTKHGTSETSEHSQQHHHHQQHSTREKVQTKDVLGSNSNGSGGGGSSSSKPVISSGHGHSSSKKNEFGSLKDEISSKVQPVHQETTVAVVASVQTPLLTSRNEMINTSKENSKKDKDKKRRASGTPSTPVSSGGGGGGSGNHSHQHQSGSSSLKCESHSNQGSSTSSSKSSSSKDKEERKERKESKSSSSSNPVESGSKNEDSHHSSGSSHHKKEKRDKEKDHRDTSADRASFPSVSKDSHSHKRDKDNKEGKTKRRLSSQENDQDRKKIKVEKESGQQDAAIHHHHKSKGSESKDSRESTKESSMATKEKISSKDRSIEKDRSTEKERSTEKDRSADKDSSSSKTEKVSGSSNSNSGSGNASSGVKDPNTSFSVQNASSEPRKEKDGKERDHHHKSKSSSSSSSSKHHSHHQLQKSSRSSVEGHSSSSSTHKQDSSTSKDFHRKDKEKEKSSGKENSSSSGSKSMSKHHSHTSHSSSSSTSKSKEAGSSSSSGKNKSSSSRKERERSKQDRTLSSLDSDDDNEGHSLSASMLGLTAEGIKSERSEKRDSESKRDRHKSGGGDSSVGGDSVKSRKSKEPKKRRRVIEDSNSSDTDDEEEEKKHHSIFDVVIDYSDYYVSMYDKVKRSNRACKNITAQQKQQEEEQKRKQDKLADSFKQLKQSRAKREEKKRSTSVEERRSNSSSDEGSHVETMNDFDDAEHLRKHHDRQSEKAHTSEDDDKTRSSTSSMKSKSKRKMKNKSSHKDEDKERKKTKRSNKSPSRPNIFSSSTLFSHSDDDSPASSSHPPEQKKKKLSSSGGSINRHQIGSLGSSNNMSFSGSTKSSDDSHSESEAITDRKKISTSSSLSSKSKSFVSFSDQIPNHQSKYNAQNIYSDSDSSDLDRHSAQRQHQSNSIQKTPTSSIAHSLSGSHRTKSKDKSGKPKNRKQPLFDSTDSSDNEEPSSAPPSTAHKEKKSKERQESKEKESTRSSKPRDRDKENKKKKHRGHKSSSLKSRKQYYITADASGDQGRDSSDKRDAAGGTATMEELFGPMTSSSDSDDMTRDSDHERPKTPTVVMTNPISSEEPAVVKKSSKSSRHHQEKSPFAISSTRTESQSVDEHGDASSIHSTPHLPPAMPKEKSSEKKKKKHHKEKRSKRGSAHEGTPLSSQSSFGKQDSVSSKSKQDSVDYDALFNSPAASPSSDLKIDEGDYIPINTTAITAIPITTIAIPCKPSSISPISKPERNHLPEIEIRAPTPQLPPVVVKPVTERDLDECEKEMRGMFSSDDDEDDEKLKITDAITDAIRASADEQDMEPSPTKEIDTEWKRKEEEELKLNSLVEQDKAIESIVLLDRKSPTPQSANPEEEVVKEEIPKDSTTISQEETDVAVATILETLGNEEEEEPLAGEAKPLLIGPVVPPVPLHSPPTLRIIEGVPQKPSVVETSESNDEIEAAIAAIPRDSSGDSNSEKEETREEPDPWGFDDNRSPKELQIDEGDTEETREEEDTVEAPVVVKREKSEEPIIIPSRSPEKVQPASFDEVSVDATETKTRVEEPIKVEPVVEPVLPPKISPRAIKEESLASKSKASDVYEFHDSDDDKRQEKAHLSHTRHTPPMISPPVKSPVVPPPITIPVPESKLQSPPLLSVPMPILQPQQPPLPPVVVPVVHVEPEKPRTVLHPVVLPPQSSPSILPTPPPPTVSSVIPIPVLPSKSIPLVPHIPPPPIVTSLPPPPPPISSVPCTPIVVSNMLRSPPTVPIPIIVPPPVAQSLVPLVPVVQPPPPPVSKRTTPPPPVSKTTPPPPPVTKTTPPPPPVTKTTPPPPPVSKTTPPPPPVSKSTPPPPPISKHTPPPPQVVATRTTIDEAIDEVIRKLHSGDPLTFTESPIPAPITSQPAQRAGRRSRSRSKDSPDENASVPRVQGRPDAHRQGTGQILGVIGGHQMDTQPTVRGIKHPAALELETNKTAKDNKVKESVIEAHPGLIPPIIQTEEGRYVPIISQPNDSQIRLPQTSLHQMPQQMQLPNRPTPVISRMVDRESPVRASVVEKHTTPLLPHQQIPISKHEGLTAMLAQQQQQQQQQHQFVAQQQHMVHQQQQQQLAAHHQQQQHMAAQHQQQLAAQHQQQMLHRKPTEPAPYGFQPQSSPMSTTLQAPMSVANAQQQQSPQSISQPTSIQHSGPPGGGIIRPVSTTYGIPLQSHHPKVTTVVSGGGPNSSPTGIPVSVQHGLPSSPFMPNVHSPASRGVFVSRANSPGGIYQHQQQQILQLTTNKPQERQSPRPSSRHTPGPIPTTAISQTGKPIQELVHLPDVPGSTTVTKINAGEEQQRKSAIMPPMPNVVLTSTAGPVMSGPPFLIKTVVSSPSQISQIQMTQQQLQQHRTLQEAFMRSAEGSIRVPPNKDNPMDSGPRPNEIIGLPQPQRVDIHGGIMHPPAHSPKPGRVPLPHEPMPSAHAGQPRNISHRPPYETPGDSSCVPLDLVTQSSNNNSIAESKSNNGRNDNEQVMALTSHAISSQTYAQPTTSTLMARKVVPQADLRIMPGHGRLGSDAPNYISSQPEHPPSFPSHYMPANLNMPNHPMGHQQPSPAFAMRHEKPGMPLDPKMSGPEQKGPSIITVVERAVSHNVPPHLSSPHGNDQRGADSPSVGAVFPGQRQLYPSSGLPQQQHPTSQAISNMYAELDGRPFAHSPSYVYDSRAISVAAAAAAAMEQERERPKGTSSPLDPPYRIRSPPSHLTSGEAGLQGDSLLQLLQRYPIMWQGLLALKNDSAAVQMHFVSGSMTVARDSLPSNPDGSIPPLRISQRMRLEQNQLEGVARKLQINAEHCMLLALPCGRDHMDVLHQSNNLRQGFITYLQLKQAAGIVNICHPDTQQAAYVIHIFPSCDFANENLAKIAPDLLSGVADIAHLLIVIATV